MTDSTPFSRFRKASSGSSSGRADAPIRENLSGDDNAHKMPLTAKPSFHNIVAGIYNSLPLVVREAIPVGNQKGAAAGAEDDTAFPADRGLHGWDDVCFIYAIPGDDQDDGVVVLADGSFRKYMECKGINALLFDEADRETMAKQFAAFANSCDSDIQLLVKSRNLPVDEYL